MIPGAARDRWRSGTDGRYSAALISRLRNQRPVAPLVALFLPLPPVASAPGSVALTRRGNRMVPGQYGPGFDRVDGLALDTVNYVKVLAVNLPAYITEYAGSLGLVYSGETFRDFFRDGLRYFQRRVPGFLQPAFHLL
jgi:hypothetical protein